MISFLMQSVLFTSSSLDHGLGEVMPHYPAMLASAYFGFSKWQMNLCQNTVEFDWTTAFHFNIESHY